MNILFIAMAFREYGLYEDAPKWVMQEPLSSHRHVPGVGTHNGQIYVIGGTNDDWEASAMVECYDPATNR